VVSGLRLKETITTLTITGNTFSNNPIGIEITSSVPDVSTWTVHYNNIAGNTLYGISNAAVIGTLDAGCNWWDDETGPSFSFDGGIGSGSGDSVSVNVDFAPWGNGTYPGATCNILPTASYDISINPDEPFVNTPFEITVVALNALGSRNFDDNNAAWFSTNYAPYVSVPGPAPIPLTDGFLEMPDGCMSTKAYQASDNLWISVTESVITKTAYSTLDSIVVHEEGAPAPPTGVSVSNVPDDNGGWIYIDYTMSVDDPFYIYTKNAGVSYYIVERSVNPVPSPPDTTWIEFTRIDPWDDGSVTNTRKVLRNAPASDSTYAYRMASVNNPSKAKFGDEHIIYEPIPMAKGASQSTWADGGSAAAKDDLPAYANMKVFLEGPYVADGLMADGADIPTISPYGIIHEVIGTLPTVPDRTLIDWVYVELRNTETGSTVKEANAFVLDNGMIVDTEGNYSLPFYYTTGIEYYIVIHHRNHLDIMSGTTFKFGDFESQATGINLSDISKIYIGTGDGAKLLEGTNYGLYAGDINNDEIVSLIDAYQIYLNRNDPSGYSIYDVTLDGIVSLIDVMDAYYNRGTWSSVPSDTKNGSLENIDPEIEAMLNDIGTKDKTVTVNILNPRIEGDYFKMEVQVERTNDWSGNGIGASDLFFTRTAGAFTGSPTTSNVNADITGSDKYTLTVEEASGKLYLQLDYNYFGGTGSDWILGLDTPETVCTVSWEINNPALTSGIVWDQVSTVVFSTSLFDPITVSYSGDGDITLPVELSTFTAQYLDKIPVIYWETESETDNMGWFVYRNNEDDFANAQKVSEFIDGHGTTSENNSYTHEDTIEDPQSGDVYYYWLESIDYGGIVHHYDKAAQLTIPDLVDPGIGQIARPEIFGLLQNAPNPFVNGTSIVFNLHQTAQVELKIYNVKGELVKDLYSGVSDYKSLQWNGTDDTGKQLSPGIYFYNLTVNGKSQEIKKLILMR